MAYVQVAKEVLYLASTDESATIGCFLLLHENKDSPNKNPYSDMLFWSSRHLA